MTTDSRTGAVAWVRRMIRMWQRGKRANELGWNTFGRAWWSAKGVNEAETSRLIRQSNRLWRMSQGQNPWRPYRGY